MASQMASPRIAALRDPAIIVVPHGRDRTLQAAVGELFLGGASLDFSNPGPGFCPACGGVGDNPPDHCSWNFLPFSADNCPDRLFLSSLAVAHDAAVGVLPVASETLTMGVEYSLVSCTSSWGDATTSHSSVCEESGSSAIAPRGVALARLPHSIAAGIAADKFCTLTSRRTYS